jgi:hypothetical protein
VYVVHVMCVFVYMMDKKIEDNNETVHVTSSCMLFL